VEGETGEGGIFVRVGFDDDDVVVGRGCKGRVDGSRRSVVSSFI
jgi:hypothetical protein